MRVLAVLVLALRRPSPTGEGRGPSGARGEASLLAPEHLSAALSAYLLHPCYNLVTSATPLPQGSMKATDVGTIMSCGVEKSSAIGGASSVLKPVAHWVQQPTMTNNMSAQIPPVQLDMTKKVAPPFHTPTPNMTGYPNTTTKLSNIPSPHLRNYDTPVAVPLVPQSVRTPPLGSSPGSAFQKRN